MGRNTLLSKLLLKNQGYFVRCAKYYFAIFPTYFADSCYSVVYCELADSSILIARKHLRGIELAHGKGGMG